MVILPINDPVPYLVPYWQLNLRKLFSSRSLEQSTVAVARCLLFQSFSSVSVRVPNLTTSSWVRIHTIFKFKLQLTAVSGSQESIDSSTQDVENPFKKSYPPELENCLKHIIVPCIFQHHKPRKIYVKIHTRARIHRGYELVRNTTIWTHLLINISTMAERKICYHVRRPIVNNRVWLRWLKTMNIYSIINAFDFSCQD